MMKIITGQLLSMTMCNQLAIRNYLQARARKVFVADLAFHLQGGNSFAEL
jgi:hypothetical protein